MPNYPIILDHDDQKDHLLQNLYSELYAVGMVLGELSGKLTDPTYDAGAVAQLVLRQDEIRDRIDQIKADGTFSYPSDDEIAALGNACDALAKIDAKTANAVSWINAGNAVVAALPVTATK